ncbi:MAG TPA: SGNH/GDSL hydrolase family protein [Pyrinomonadaceae bacterium]|jgi:lysophospholipase L1-like esterase|nr:SGNH/GDSL hydrolase family protein [Pyrinomonadaceae bacterium]
MTRKSLLKAGAFPAGLLLLFFLSATTAFADCPNQTTLAADDPFHLLVLGDSIMWGQGLREEEKFSSRVKCWLQERINREVRVHVEAHSGAVISGAAQPGFTAVSGEVNLRTPTINQQLDHAVEFYNGNGTRPSLILMNGCINDVGVKNLLAASTPLEDLREQVRKSCGEEMQVLLQRVRRSFPQARVLVTSYYPIVSPQTADNAFLRLLVKNLNNQRPEARRLTDKEMRQHLIAISDEWYNTSTASLLEAVTKTNAAGADSSSPDARFVEIQFGPEHVFAAPDSLLWNFMFASTNVSGFAKVIVILSFGTAAYKANDHMRDTRIKSCEETFKKPKGIKEDKKLKSAREDLLLVCRYASLGHPNHMGALIYTEAIKGQLLQLIDKAGWKRDTNNPQTLP